MEIDNDSPIISSPSYSIDSDVDYLDGDNEQRQFEALDYMNEEIVYEEEIENNSNESKDMVSIPYLNHDQVRKEIYSLFISAYRTKFGSTDKEIHSLLHFLRIALADIVEDPSTCFLPKSFKTIEKEFKKEEENDIIEYIVCGKCHKIYPPHNDNVS